MRPSPNLEGKGPCCQGYHTLAEGSGFKAPDTRPHPLHPPDGLDLMAMLNNCQLGHFLPLPETPTRYECFHRALVIAGVLTVTTKSLCQVYIYGPIMKKKAVKYWLCRTVFLVGLC